MERAESEKTQELERRLALLEDLAFDSFGLQSSVDRLGLNAAALGEALLQVDRHQQQLTQFGHKLRSVESHSVSDIEVHAITQAEARRVKHERRQSMAIVIFPVVLVLLALMYGVDRASHSSCENRHLATKANIKVLEGFLSGDAAVDVTLNRGIKDLQDTMRVSCDEQYWLSQP